MSSNLTQEQKNNIRKNLPLKIFDRREDAQCLLDNIEFLKKEILEIRGICPTSTKPYFTLKGKDAFGNSRTVKTYLMHHTYEFVKNAFIEGFSITLKAYENLYAEIPNAKIIPFDFRKREVEPDRQPCPNPPPEKEEPKTIIEGAGEIAKAAGIHYSDVRPFVRRKGLPAFKIPGRKFWFAFPEEIEKWKKEHGGDTNAN